MTFGGPSSDRCSTRERTLQAMFDPVEDTRRLLKQAGRSPKTANSYLSHIRRLVGAYGSKATSLSTDELRRYLEGLVDESKSLSYINQAQSAIRFLYTKVCNRPNPLPGPGIVTKKVPLHGIFTREEVKQILNHVHDVKYRLALMLVYSSGLRVGETAYLRRKNIDFDKSIVHVNDRSGKHIRDSILSSSCARLIRDYLNMRTDDSTYLFPGRGRSSYVSARTIQRAFAEALLAANIPKHSTLGWLRHSFAVHLLEDGVDRRMVQHLLGISTPSMITPYLKLARNRDPLRVLSPLDRFYP
jgi:integrase/recombinase XerD